MAISCPLDWKKVQYQLGSILLGKRRTPLKIDVFLCGVWQPRLCTHYYTVANISGPTYLIWASFLAPPKQPPLTSIDMAVYVVSMCGRNVTNFQMPYQTNCKNVANYFFNFFLGRTSKYSPIWAKLRSITSISTWIKKHHAQTNFPNLFFFLPR